MAFFISTPQYAPQLLKSFRFLVIFLLAAVAPLMLQVAGAQAIGGPLPPESTWAGTGNLNTARFNHTATLLPNGQVMVTGGHDTSSTALSSVELYDPATGSWSYIPAINTARCNHTATLLPNGKVLVAGGDNGSGVALDTAELYDPVMGYWTYTMPLNTSRYSHTATLLPNGKVLLAGGANAAGIALNSSEIFDPATGYWTPTGPLNTARLNHTATLLPNGKVLVAGGKDNDAGGNHLVSAELFDPTAASGAGAWTPTGDLNVARSFHTATLLPNGRVLAAGGEDRDDAEVYNPTDGTWTHIGFLYYGTRGFHTATLLPNGRVLLAGGYSGVNYLNSAELYDPVAGTFGTTGFLAGARRSHTATLLPNGLVLVAGGADGTSSLNTSEVYASPPATWTAATGTWAATGNLNIARQNHTVTLLPNGNVLVAGGNNGSYLTSAELYDPVAGTWAITGSLATAREFHTATLLPNGKVLVAGGYNASSGALSSAELYDPVTGTWSNTGSLIEARYGHTATLLPNGKVLVAGGYLGSFLNTAELYDPVTGTWSNTGFLLGGRDQHTATLLPNGKVLVVGGYLLASAELYDPDAGTWSLTGSPNVGRWRQTATLLPNGQVLVAGGYNVISGYLSSSEVYDPRYGTWTTTSGSLNTARSLHTANLLPNGGVLAAAGYNDSSGYLSSAEVYDPATGNWSATGPLSIGCQLHRAILLPNGLVLATGGYNGSTALNTAQLYGVFHTITATSSTGGSISPSGAVAAEDGLPKTFTITPDAGFIVQDVQVDGESVGDVTSYTFPNVTTTHTITASFAASTVTITASAGAGGTISPSGAVPVNYGSDQGFSITPNTGYHIADVTVDGVSQGAVGSYTFSNVTTPHTIAASFALDTFTITASAGAGGAISPSGAVLVNYGSDQGFSITATTGYHIADVTVDGVSQGAVGTYTFNTVTANHTIAASFALDTFTITASAGAGGTISPSGAVLVNYGSDQGFSITATTGYHIADVTVDGVSQGAVSTYNFSTVTANHTIAASFAPDTFTIGASAGAGGTISPSGAVLVNYGSSQGFSITATTGYHIADVMVDGVSQGAVSSYTFSTVTANHTIAASFALDTFTITASAGAGGAISPSGAVSVNYGGSQGFSITATTGYHIADVTVDGVSQGAVSTYNFSTVTANHTIAASFAPDTFTITASAGAGGNISPAGAVSVNYGGSQTFNILPYTGYYVSNVLVDGVSVGAVTSYTFNNVISNHTIAAVFATGAIAITASAGPGGTISPSGTVSVNYGSSRSFTITPNKGFHVADVLVDGSSVGARTNYTFYNVTTNHTIEARFAMSLAFPLPGYTAATAPVSAVMDNSVLERTPVQFYVPGNVVKAFNGETGEKQYGVTYLDPYGKYWPAYKNSSGTNFFPPNGGGVRPLNYLNGPYLSYAGIPGYNYQVPQGTQVLATGDGKLYQAVTDPVNGAGYSYYYNSYIDHQNGYYSWYLYAPLTADILAQIKQNGYAQVTQGQVIGQTLGDHLHFEVRLNGSGNANVVDPYKLGLWLSDNPVTKKALPWLQLLLDD